MKTVHFISGLLIALFVFFHLLNHLAALWGAEKHIRVMNRLRKVYRHRVIENILLSAVAVQIISGITFVYYKPFRGEDWYNKLHVLSGLYLALFLIVHVSAVIIGRKKVKLDTNIYYGAMGLNSFPAKLFFIPYYSLAILSFFTHIACIHKVKVEKFVPVSTAIVHFYIIIATGIVVLLLIMYGMTNRFKGLRVPRDYFQKVSNQKNDTETAIT